MAVTFCENNYKPHGQELEFQGFAGSIADPRFSERPSTFLWSHSLKHLATVSSTCFIHTLRWYNRIPRTTPKTCEWEQSRVSYGTGPLLKPQSSKVLAVSLYTVTRPLRRRCFPHRWIGEGFIRLNCKYGTCWFYQHLLSEPEHLWSTYKTHSTITNVIHTWTRAKRA